MKPEWTRLAIEDRIRIFEYIANHNPHAAIKVDDCIIEQIEWLMDFPEIGRPGRIKHTRELVIHHTPYIVAYDVTTTAIRILRILHGAQLWPAVIDKT